MFTIIGNEAERASLMDHLCLIFGFVFIRCNVELNHEPSKELHNLSFLRLFHGHGKKIIGFNRFSQSYYLLNLPRSLLI